MSAVDEFLAYDEEHGIEKTAGLYDAIGGGLRRMFAQAPEAVAAQGAALGQAAAKGSPGAAKQSFGDLLGQTLTGTAAVGLAGAATGAALGTAEKLWDLAANTISRVHGFQTMMEANPELDKMDRQKVHTVYSTLHRFNPEMARDPFVAGAWVKKLTEYDYVDPKTVGDLISARSKVQGGDYFQRGVQIAQQGAQFGALEAAKAYAKDQATRSIGQANQMSDLQNAAMMSAAQQYGKDFAGLSDEAIQGRITGEVAKYQGQRQAEKQFGPTPQQQQESAKQLALAQAQGRGEYEASGPGMNQAFQSAFNQAAGRGAYEGSHEAMKTTQRKATYQERGKERA